MTKKIWFAAAAVMSIAAAAGAAGPAAAASCGTSFCAMAKDDVDIYDSPVEPRSAYPGFFMHAGDLAAVQEYHPDGWCRLQGVAPDGGDGWVAKDHLTNCPHFPTPGWARTKDDVDVLAGPGGQFPKIGELVQFEMGKVLEYHPDGWCKLEGMGNGNVDGWVAQDHLENCP